MIASRGSSYGLNRVDRERDDVGVPGRQGAVRGLLVVEGGGRQAKHGLERGEQVGRLAAGRGRLERVVRDLRPAPEPEVEQVHARRSSRARRPARLGRAAVEQDPLDQLAACAGHRRPRQRDACPQRHPDQLVERKRPLRGVDEPERPGEVAFPRLDHREDHACISPHFPSYCSIVLRLSRNHGRVNLSEAPQQLGELLDARLADETRAASRRRAARRRARPPASGACSPSSARADRRRRRPARRRRPRRSRGSGRPRRRRAARRARIGRSAARYSNTFPERTPLPRPPASGMSRSSASESRCSSSERRRGTYGISSSRSPSPSASAHSRSAARKSPTKRATTSSRPDSRERRQERPRVALAEERAGVRDPEAARRGVYSSPAKSSKSEPFAIVTTRPRGASARVSSAIASETQRRSRRRGARRRARRRAGPAP